MKGAADPHPHPSKASGNENTNYQKFDGSGGFYQLSVLLPGQNSDDSSKYESYNGIYTYTWFSGSTTAGYWNKVGG